MIEIRNVWVPPESFNIAIRGMRNPMDSWDKSDSRWAMWQVDNVQGGVLYGHPKFEVGPNDLKIMLSLSKAGPVHAKFRRYITVYMDILAPLYWWKEFDTYRTGVSPNPFDIDKIHAKAFSLKDFSHEHLLPRALENLKMTIEDLNHYRNVYNEGYSGDENGERKVAPKSKEMWWQIIQLLPSSYNQKRTVMLNYESAAHLYADRCKVTHKLDEWGRLGQALDDLPYSSIITGKTD